MSRAAPPQRILQRFENVQETGDGQYQASCSAHPDGKPSLSISVGSNGKTILFCQAGCSTSDVLAKAGLGYADLDSRPSVVGTYDYDNEDGELEFVVERRSDKSFSQKQPDPNNPDKWINNIKGVAVVPYRLMRLREALERGDDVAVAEGEKDVEALWLAYEVTATCNSGGAGKWKPEHSAFFRGSKSNVTIVADRDKPGYKHALAVQESLLAVAGIESRIVLSAIGKDAADHVENYGFEEFIQVTPAELRERINEPEDVDPAHEAAVIARVESLKVDQEARVQFAAAGWAEPDDSGSWAEQLSREVEPLQWLIEELAFVGANVLLLAVAKSGKSLLALNVARSILNGELLFGRFPVARLPEGRSVAWFNAELTKQQARLWLTDLDFPRPEAFHPQHLRGYSVPFEAQQVEDWAVAWLTERKVSVWILDPKSALFTGEENSATETGLWLAAIDRIKRRAGVETLILVHHASEASDMDEPDDKALRLLRGRGSTRLEGWADIIWSYSGRFMEPRYLGALGRDVDLAPFGGIHMDSRTRLLRWDGATAAPSVDRKQKRMLEAYDALVAADGPLKSHELYGQMVGTKRDPKVQAVNWGVEQGYIVRVDGPSNSKLHTPGDRDPRAHTLSFQSETEQ